LAVAVDYSDGPDTPPEQVTGMACDPLYPQRYRLYVDEYGDEGMSEKSIKQNRYLTLIGVAFEVRYYRDEFQPMLEQFKREHLAYDPDDPPILHKDDIRKRNGVFRVLRDVERQKSFDEGLLEVLRSAEFMLVCVVVDKRACKDKYRASGPNPYHFALGGLLARYAGYLNVVVGGRGDVLAEARYPKADRDLGEAYRFVYANGTTWLPGPRPLGGDLFQKALTSKEIKIKAKDRNIAGLQLADLLTYCCYVDTMCACRGLDLPESMGDYTRKVLDVVSMRYNRRCMTGDINGYGRVLISPT
jgi:hypothetical protein